MIDGEHYASVVRDALEAMSHDVVAAVLVGGTEKLRGGEDYGVPLVTGLVTHADPAWVDQAVRRNGDGPIAAVALSLRAFQAPAQGQAAEGQTAAQ